MLQKEALHSNQLVLLAGAELSSVDGRFLSLAVSVVGTRLLRLVGRRLFLFGDRTVSGLLETVEDLYHVVQGVSVANGMKVVVELVL